MYLSLRHEIAAMLTTGGGTIVNAASVAGLIADPGMAPYAAAKHGVVGLTKAVALDYAPQGRVSEPGETANLILFLASDLSPFVTGAVYTIDGGQTAH